MDTQWPPIHPISDAALMTANLSVDIYYINIGEGDSAIYYLVQHPPVENEDRKPYVHRACLMDGGTSAGSGAIWEFLNTRVPQMYHWDTTQGHRDPKDVKFPPFDSIVITHWDFGKDFLRLLAAAH